MTVAGYMILGIILITGEAEKPVSLADLDRFPSRVATECTIAQTKAHLQRVYALMALSPRDREDLADYGFDVACLLAKWELLHEAQTEREWLDSGHWWEIPDHIRLEWLRQLRDRIGPAAYAAGEMPVPFSPEVLRD